MFALILSVFVYGVEVPAVSTTHVPGFQTEALCDAALELHKVRVNVNARDYRQIVAGSCVKTQEK